jgi:hypothetical protein
MPRPRTLQEFLHWLELGHGSKVIRLTAALLAMLLLSLLVSWKQFHGVTSETALLQADVGRQLARGEGFTTLVNYPQTAAYLAQRGIKFETLQPYPELHQAPFYSLVIAGALRVLPVQTRESLFAFAPVPPDGFRADYFLLGLNVVLLWFTAWLTFHLARRLFDSLTGWVAVLALLLSVGIWQQTVSVNGTPLLMLLSVATFCAWERAEDSLAHRDEALVNGGVTTDGRLLRWLGILGALCGLLFLTEYSAGALLAVALVYAAFGVPRRQRRTGIAALILGFVVIAGPWMGRNLRLTDSPVALAAQNVALKQGDPTAEPAGRRNTFSAARPAIDLAKLANKTLTTVQENLRSRLWSGGAMWLAAFFVAGCLYTFRSSRVNRLRWIFAASFAVLMLSQAALNSGESERLVTGWLAPLLIVFGTGFFFVLLGGNAVLGASPRLCAAGLLLAQSLPLLHDVAEPRRLHFQYPPYFPGLFMGMREELARRGHAGRFGIMADVPAGVAWYGQQRVWAQPVKLRDFYAITLEQPLGELLLTPRTLDRPFFSELAAKPIEPGSLGAPTNLFGEWGRIYAGLLTGMLPPEFPLSAPQKLAENLYVMLNPSLPPIRGK